MQKSRFSLYYTQPHALVDIVSKKSPFSKCYKSRDKRGDDVSPTFSSSFLTLWHHRRVDLKPRNAWKHCNIQQPCHIVKYGGFFFLCSLRDRLEKLSSICPVEGGRQKEEKHELFSKDEKGFEPPKAKLREKTEKLFRFIEPCPPVRPLNLDRLDFALLPPSRPRWSILVIHSRRKDGRREDRETVMARRENWRAGRKLQQNQLDWTTLYIV